MQFDPDKPLEPLKIPVPPFVADCCTQAEWDERCVRIIVNIQDCVHAANVQGAEAVHETRTFDIYAPEVSELLREYNKDYKVG